MANKPGKAPDNNSIEHASQPEPSPPPPPPPAAAVPPEIVDAIKTDFGRLDVVTPGLGERAAAFILSGTPQAVLLELANHQQAAFNALVVGPHYALAGAKPQESFLHARRLVLESALKLPVQLLYRLGHVGEATDTRAGYRRAAVVDEASWLRWLVFATEQVAIERVWNKPNGKVIENWSISRLDQCLQETGKPRELVLHMLYGPKDYYWDNFAKQQTGLGPWLATSHTLVAAAAHKLDAAGRLRLVEDLGRLGLASGQYRRLVFDIAAGSAKVAATAARTALIGVPFDELAQEARRAFASKDGAVRRAAAETIAQLGGIKAQPVLQAQFEAELSKPVKDALSALMTQVSALSDAPREASVADDGSTRLPAIDGSVIVLPPMPPPPPDPKLPPDAIEPLRRAAKAFNQGAEKHNQEGEAKREVALRDKQRFYFHKVPTVSDHDVDCVLSVANGTDMSRSPYRSLFREQALKQCGVDDADVRAFIADPRLSLWHLQRLAIPGMSQWRTLLMVLEHPSDMIERALAERIKREETDFRTLVAMQCTYRPEIKPDDLVRRMTQRYYGPNAEDELHSSLEHYVLEHLDVLEEALGVRPPTGETKLDEMTALRLIGRLSKVPERLLPPLLDRALSTRKIVRTEARKLLANAKGIDEAILARLVDPQKQVRATAADWLADRETPNAADAIKMALKKEKAELARAAMLSAIAKLGEDISSYFDEKSLKAEAEAGLAKASPKGLDWFPFKALPRMRWRGGKAISDDVVRWWIVLADKLKDPQGNALFDLYLDRAEPADSETLGSFILKAWIERDTTSPSDADANAYAEQMTNQQMQWATNWQKNDPAHKLPDRAALFRSFRNAKLADHLYSASDNKGVLGLAVRAPGSEAAALVRAYAKEHGKKVNQTKALLACLARNPSPAALQVVLSVSNRIKQKTVQAYAGELVSDAAERRGWTTDELADRTIPSAGLDEDGVLALDCGEGREFRALYMGEGKLDLVNADGKSVKAMPAPRHDGEKEQVATAKKLLANARKEVKQTEAAQYERLYEAMCVGRAWPLDLWTTCLKQHPIAGRLVQRLVWQGLDDAGAAKATFRLLDDGSFTDTNDDTVPPDRFTHVRLAHRALLDEAAAKAWVKHMADYEVTPLFAQLNRPLFKLDEAGKKQTAISERKGWMIESLKLKSIATKLGYQTGEVGDGGSYMDYVKRFNGAGVIVSVGFTGSYMGAGAERIAAALTDLQFFTIGSRGRTLELGKVPPVLVSEAIADLHVMADAGTGFDKDWEKKGLW